MGVVDASWLAWMPFLVGWSLGWLLLARRRRLPSAAGRSGSVAVIIPARDEAAALARLLPSLTAQLGRDDRLVVVDDGSADDTAAVARRLGAEVITAPPPPAGWTGKSHACWLGAGEVATDVVVFVDADVIADAALLDAVTTRVDADAPALVSVQPRHTPGSPVEQLSLFGNLVALMGTGRWSLLGGVARSPLAFGPVMALPLRRYRDVGGHGHAAVCGAVAEDVALARIVGASAVYAGGPLAAFRMYPGGMRDLVDGWTRVVAAGVGAAPWWATAGTAAWIWSVAAAPFVGWWAYLLAALQIGLLARRAGRFSPVAAALYPIPLAVFVAIAVRSVVRRVAGRPVRWKGRAIPPT